MADRGTRRAGHGRTRDMAHSGTGMSRRLIMTLAAGACATLLAADAAAMRCGGQLVGEGDRSYEVRRACGPPQAIEPLDRHHHHHAPHEETWYYDFGDQRLLRVLSFRDGELRRIETRGRGLAIDDARGGACRPTEIVRGMTRYELVRRCGEPAERTHRHVLHKALPGTHPHLVEEVVVEEWFYDFGRGYLPRRLRLVDGEVVRIEARP